MAITINSQPSAICASRNPIRYEIVTDEYINTSGVYAEKMFTFDTFPANGDYIRIGSTIMGISYFQFDCVTTPTEPYQFAPKDPAVDVKDWLDDELIPALKSIWYISQNYDVYRTSLALVIRAKEYGPDYSFSTWTLSGFTVTYYTQNAGVAIDKEDPFSIRYRIHLELEYKDGEFICSEWFFKVPEDDGRLVLNVEEIVDALFDGLYLPSVSLTAQTREDLSMRRLTVEFAEHYGDSPYESASYFSDYRNVIKGGLATRDLDSDFMARFYTAKKFVTNLPDNTRVDPSTIHYLHFLVNHTLVENRYVSAKIYWTDGTNDSVIKLVSSIFLDKDLWGIPAGFNTLNLQAVQPAKQAYKYEIWVWGSGSTITIAGPKSFMLVDQHQLAGTLQFYNSYGVLESVLCYGESRLSDQPAREHLEIDLPNTIDSEDSRYLAYAIESQQMLELSTGPVDQDHMLALSDVLISPQLFWIPPYWLEQKRYAVVLEPQTAQLGYRNNKGEFVNGLRLTVRFNREHNNSNFNKHFI